MNRIMLFEDFINEMKVNDPGMIQQIKEFARLSNEIDKITNQLKGLQKQYKDIESVLTPVLEELNETQETALEVDDILVTIKTKGYTRQNFSYQKAYTWLHDRVNAKMKQIIEESLQETKTISKIATKIGVQKISEDINENIIKSIFSKIKSGINNLLGFLKKTNKSLKNDVLDFKSSMNI